MRWLGEYIIEMHKIFTIKIDYNNNDSNVLINSNIVNVCWKWKLKKWMDFIF